MSDPLQSRPGLRRRLAMMLLVVGTLVLANIILFERLQWRFEETSNALASYAEIYKLSRRIQSSLETLGPGEARSLQRFRQGFGDYDRDMERYADLAEGNALIRAGNPELALLIEGLEGDWKSFRDAYRTLRGYDGRAYPNALAEAIDRAANEVQASVIAVTFTVQGDRLSQFEWLKRSIYGLAVADLVILAMIMVWLRRSVVEPVERITAAARRMADADFAARVETVTDDEIGELGRHLNSAAERVQGLLAEVERESGALREAESKFRSLAEESLIGIYMIQDGCFVYVNPRFSEIFGYAQGEIAARLPAATLVHPDDRDLVRDQLRRRVSGELRSVQYEFRGLRKDGTVVPVEVIGSAGTFRGRPAVIGTLLDLSERKRSEAQILRLGRAVEQSPATVVITDRGGLIEYVNPKFSALTGYAYGEAIGKTPSLVQSGLTPPEVYASLWSSLLAGNEWQGEILNRKKSGELFWEHMVASPVRDADGEITHFIAVKEDITERKRAEDELHRANRTLQVLSSCNQALVHAVSAQALVDSICYDLVRLGGFGLACIAVAEDAAATAVGLMACAGPGDEYELRLGAGERGTGASGECIRSRSMRLANDLAAVSPDSEWKGDAPGFGLRSAIALPLTHGGECHGALTIYSGEAEAFSADEVKLLTELADDLAYGLHSFEARAQIDAQATELMIRQRAIESSRNGVMITRCDEKADNPIIYVNAAFESITGYPRGEVVGRNPRFLLGQHWEQPEVERLRDALRRGGEVEVTLRNTRQDGVLFWNNLSLSPVHDPQGRVTHFISVLNDVTDRVRYQQELQHHVTHDTVTGLANRALLNDRIEQALAHASRSDRKAAVLMIDLDRFKLINDSLGHPVGDELLRLVAGRLAAVIRKGDTVARVGSDEFVIVLAELDRAEQTQLIADKIAKAFVPAYTIGGQEAFVSASVGSSVAPDDGSDAEALLRNAEVAMFAVKSAGGNGHRAYAQSMGEASRDRIGIETDLRRGLERGELELFYQPKVAVRDGTIVGAEALIRWRHPERGLVPPIQFIPLAEETGLIGPIGDWVIEEALRQLRAWQRDGVPRVKIAANLSARQFRDHELVPRIRARLAASEVDPQWLELELTESMLMQRGESTVAVLHELHGSGLSLAIDDFGTGYSSLSYLQRFPIDTLKIDRSFVMDLETSRDSRVLAETILMMARNLGKSVVAEGVETIGQADILQRAGCEVIQGFLYSRPVPLAEFTELLHRRRLVPQPPTR